LSNTPLTSESPFVPTEMPRDALLDALAAGAVVATGNARLARSLAAEFDRRMLAAGATAWPTPAVLPLSAWLQAAHEEASLRSPTPLPRVLGAEQEEQVWAAVIREDLARRPAAPLRVEATAHRARQSWELVCEFRLDLADGRFGLTENPEAFRRWAQRFSARNRERSEIPAAALPARLLPLLAEGRIPLPPQLLLAGFYVLTPVQQALVAALRAAGCAVDWVAFNGDPGVAVRLRADDPRREVERVADWARGLLEQQPGLRLGIVVPDLGARRAVLVEALRRALDPGALLPGAAPAPRPWNISLGRPLASYPVVATALRLLGLMRSPADTEALGLLLLSPHWALPDDAAARCAELERRALLDRRIRRLGDARLPLATLRFHAGGAREDESTDVSAGYSARPWHSARLAARLDALLALSRELPARGDAGTWAAHFAAWLTAADWGAYGRGGRPLDSHEYQAAEAWSELLSRFSGLTDYAGPLSLGEALALAGRLATETLFQPRAGDASVQVLGLYEAFSQSFDRLWVLGLHDGVWPPAPRPDPFLPLGLQRERGLPHSGPDLELEWATDVTAQLQRSAAEIVFSYPARDGDQHLQCSPLIAALPEVAASALPCGSEPGWRRRVSDSATSDAVPPSAAVPLRHPQVPGGSRVFADQAACPFRAFANHRLGAAPLERTQAGLDPMRRGTLAHRLLALVWAELETQANLLALDQDALRARLRVHIESLLETERRRSPATVTARFRAVEAQRLEDQAVRWLNLERERSAFTVVAQEEGRRFETGGVSVRLFIDRIDRLADGARVVLDYKTGTVRPSAWFGERPEEPQLPLYGVAVRGGPPAGSMTADGPVAAVAFAQIRADGVAFNGVVREPGLLPGLPARRKGPLQDATGEWPAVLDEWARELERLAAGFRAGTAEVDPKRGLHTCEATYCELQPLCRVRESLALASGATEGEGDGEAGDDE
jgi:probable DNA repair protein